MLKPTPGKWYATVSFNGMTDKSPIAYSTSVKWDALLISEGRKVTEMLVFFNIADENSNVFF
jgi:hypothetical protein